MPNSPARPALAALLIVVACLPTFDRPEGDPDTALAPADLGANGPPPWADVSGTASGAASTATSSTASTSAGEASTGSSSTTDPATTRDPEPRSLHDLRLTEILADPEGKDGGVGSPEIVEITNSGDDVVPLAAIELLARTWPRLDARALGLADAVLGPGESLLLRRFASEGEADTIGLERDGEVLRVSFVTSAGLRNADGAVTLQSARGAHLDAVIYGVPAPAPHDDPAAWRGDPAVTPAPGLSLCRADPSLDTDTAVDWIACAPSPGSVGNDLPMDDDTTGTSTSDGEPMTAAIVITEVLSNAPGPGSGEKFLEYVELLNLGPGDLDLSGFTIADDVDPGAPGRDPLLHRAGDGGCGLDLPLCLAEGQRALIVGNLYEGPIGEALVLETDDSTIADGGLSAAEAVVLRDADDLVRSTYRAWEDPLSEPYPVAVDSPLHRLDVDAIDEPAAWIYGDPSPGLP